MAGTRGDRTWLDWRSRLGGVRVRSALSAAAVVTAAVGVVTVWLIFAAETTLTANIDTTAQERSDQVVAAVQSGDPGQVAEALRATPGDLALVQVLDPTGRVVAASAAITGGPALTTQRPDPGQSVRDQRRLPLLPGEDPFRILTTAVPTDAGTWLVVVAQPMEPVNESIEAISGAAAVAIPLLAAVVGLATFVFVGRSLRPVERIRQRVSTITGRERDARVPVPAARDEIAALAETMNGMLDRLQSAAEAQRRFVADASHELRSPLTTLRVGLDVLAANPDVPRSQIGRLQAEAARLGQLVADLLLLARIDEHAVQLADEEVDLDDLVYAERDRLQSQHPRLAVRAHIQPVRVRGDARHLGRAIRNLADNAARHARAQVTLSVDADGGQARLSVCDDGTGIAAADRERVFDRFIRLDDSRTRADGGAGLGLAIAREIVHAHAGTLVVVVDGGPAGGACLCMRLPVAGDGPGGFDEPLSRGEPLPESLSRDEPAVRP